MAAKKDSAPGPDGISIESSAGAGGLGSQFLFNAYKHVLEGDSIPARFAESRTVFIPMSSDVDNNGRIVRSPEALRPVDVVQLRLQEYSPQQSVEASIGTP